MYVFAIIASFQGVIDREQVVLMCGEEARGWSLEDVWLEYGLAVENCAKVTEYMLDGFEVS